MKIMNVSFSIDVKNVEHVNALTAFMQVLGEHPTQQETSVAPDVNPAEPKKQKAKAFKAETPAETTSSVQAEESDAQPEPEPQVEEPQQADTPVIALDVLRTRVSELAKKGTEMREILKAKLKELGAESVSTLAESEYCNFYKYLQSL